MNNVAQSRNSDNTPIEKSPFPANIGPKTGTLRVRKVSVRHEKVFGGKRYELETTNVRKGSNDIIHIDPKQDPEVYAQMIALVPAIADLTYNDTTRRSVVLAKYWSVQYKYIMRLLESTHGAYVATKITELPNGPEPEAATIEPPKEKESLNDWFPRDKDGKPVDDPKTDELMDSLKTLVGKDTDETPDELTVWSAVNAPKDSQQFAAFNHFKRELAVIDSTADASEHILKALDGAPLGVYIAEHGIQDACDKLQSHLNNLPNSIVSKTALETPEITLPAIGVQDMTNEPASAQNSSVNEGNVPALPEAPFSANFRLWDKHGVDVLFTIRADTVSEGCKKVDITIENRLANGYTTRQQGQAQSLPSNATPITSAPSAQPVPAPSATPVSNGGGTYPVTQIKKIVDEGKTRIELFSREGDEKPAGAVRRPGDIALLAAVGIAVDQLAAGTRYSVALEAEWKDGAMNPKNNKPFRDIVAIRKTA